MSAWTTAGERFRGLEKTYEGHDGIRRYWSDLRDPWEEITMSAIELHGDNDTIVTVFEFQGRGRDGIEVRRELGNVLRFREGSVINLEAHDDPAAAFRSAGITEKLRTKSDHSLCMESPTVARDTW